MANEPERTTEQQPYELQLRQAIERLYDVFERYPLKKMDACEDCIFPEDHALLRSKGLRDFTADELENYSFKAMTTWGDVDDFKHFLPRLLELVASDPNGIVTQWVLGSKLKYAEWQQWPEDEQEALLAFMLALWKRSIRQLDPTVLVDKLLCYIAGAGIDVHPYLDEWIAACRDSETAAYYLACFVDTVVFDTGKVVTKGARPSTEVYDPVKYHPIGVWLCEPSTSEALEQAFYSTENAELLEHLSEAIGQLEWLRSVPDMVSPCL